MKYRLTYGCYLINESIWAGMVVGEGFINHQEHDAGEEGQGQDDQNRHLERGQGPVSKVIKDARTWFMYLREGEGEGRWHTCSGVCLCVCVVVMNGKTLLSEVDGCSG